LPILVTLVMEGIISSETLVLTRATQCYIPQDRILHSLPREHIKCSLNGYSYKMKKYLHEIILLLTWTMRLQEAWWTRAHSRARAHTTVHARRFAHRCRQKNIYNMNSFKAQTYQIVQNYICDIFNTQLHLICSALYSGKVRKTFTSLCPLIRAKLSRWTARHYKHLRPSCSYTGTDCPVTENTSSETMSSPSPEEGNHIIRNLLLSSVLEHRTRTK
jgi:hypothetical protein